MKTLTLSDFPGDRMRSLQQKRENSYNQKIEDRDEAIKNRLLNIEKRRESFIRAKQSRDILKTIWKLIRYGVAHLSSVPDHPVMRPPGKTEGIWRAGVQGERNVACHFEQILGDEWTLVSGYNGKKGEIDQLLVGPQGIYAIEIKSLSGVIYCDGDLWWRDKYDQYGNLVEHHVPIKDDKGRAPSRQLNDAAYRLRSILSKQTRLTRIYRVVIFSHHSVRLGDLKNITVDWVVTLNNLNINSLFAQSSDLFDETETDKMIRVIQEDHVRT